jgi:hypothetical protein
LIGQAGSTQRNECEDANQEPKQIEPPMQCSDALHAGPIAPQHRSPIIASRLSFQATPSIVRSKQRWNRPAERERL